MTALSRGDYNVTTRCSMQRRLLQCASLWSLVVLAAGAVALSVSNASAVTSSSSAVATTRWPPVLLTDSHPAEDSSGSTPSDAAGTPTAVATATRRLAAAPMKRCSQRAVEANSLAKQGWKLRFMPFLTPEKCPKECRQGATVPPGGIYNVTCAAERCGCRLSTVTAAGRRVTRQFSISRDGVFDDKSSLGAGCPSMYYSRVECLGAQAWCKPGEC